MHDHEQAGSERPLPPDAHVANTIWDLMRASAKGCYTSLEASSPDASNPLTRDEQFHLSREIIIAHLWAISKAIPKDTRVLDILHDRYLKGHYNMGATDEQKADLGTTAHAELTRRYNTYYQAWETDERHRSKTGEAGTVLAIEMLQYFLPEKRDALNFFLMAQLHSHILKFIASVIELRKRIALTEN
jgi:hypothetical protein